jgi:cation diffusion facilitator CzcD-associated flavoprotein CzcO
VSIKSLPLSLDLTARAKLTRYSGNGVLENELQKTKPGDRPGNRQYTFTDADKQRFRDDPEYHLDFRRRIEAEMNSQFDVFFQGSETSKAYRKIMTKEMEQRIGPGHEELKKFIIPTWSPGCRRISPGNGFLEALVQPNVEPIYGDPAKIVPEGIISEDGQLHKIDILVCATGYNAAFRPPFSIINGYGKTLHEDWDEQTGGGGANLYFGVSAPRFPNYYTIVVSTLAFLSMYFLMHAVSSPHARFVY